MKEYTIQVTASLGGIYKVSAETEDEAHQAASQLFSAEYRFGDGMEEEIDFTTEFEGHEGPYDVTYDARKVIDAEDYSSVYEYMLKMEKS